MGGDRAALFYFLLGGFLKIETILCGTAKRAVIGSLGSLCSSLKETSDLRSRHTPVEEQTLFKLICEQQPRALHYRLSSLGFHYNAHGSLFTARSEYA